MDNRLSAIIQRALADELCLMHARQQLQYWIGAIEKPRKGHFGVQLHAIQNRLCAELPGITIGSTEDAIWEPQRHWEVFP